MTRKQSKERVSFLKPIVTPRQYVVQGPSGWVETFARSQLDTELVQWLGRVPLAQTVETFILQRSLSDRITTWETVIGFLARLFDIQPHDVPPEIGLAFWGQVELALADEDAN